MNLKLIFYKILFNFYQDEVNDLYMLSSKHIQLLASGRKSNQDLDLSLEYFIRGSPYPFHYKVDPWGIIRYISEHCDPNDLNNPLYQNWKFYYHVPDQITKFCCLILNKPLNLNDAQGNVKPVVQLIWEDKNWKFFNIFAILLPEEDENEILLEYGFTSDLAEAIRFYDDRNPNQKYDSDAMVDEMEDEQNYWGSDSGEESDDKVSELKGISKDIGNNDENDDDKLSEFSTAFTKEVINNVEEDYDDRSEYSANFFKDVSLIEMSDEDKISEYSKVLTKDDDMNDFEESNDDNRNEYSDKVTNISSNVLAESEEDNSEYSNAFTREDIDTLEESDDSKDNGDIRPFLKKDISSNSEIEEDKTSQYSNGLPKNVFDESLSNAEDSQTNLLDNTFEEEDSHISDFEAEQEEINDNQSENDDNEKGVKIKNDGDILIDNKIQVFSSSIERTALSSLFSNENNSNSSIDSFKVKKEFQGSILSDESNSGESLNSSESARPCSKFNEHLKELLRAAYNFSSILGLDKGAFIEVAKSITEEK